MKSLGRPSINRHLSSNVKGEFRLARDGACVTTAREAHNLQRYLPPADRHCQASSSRYACPATRRWVSREDLFGLISGAGRRAV